MCVGEGGRERERGLVCVSEDASVKAAESGRSSFTSAAPTPVLLGPTI
jgi:hypothetical protein